MIKYIFPVADLHFDRAFGAFNIDGTPWLPPILPSDEETALLVAGDTAAMKWWRSEEAAIWLSIISKRFPAIIFIRGNNERFDDYKGRKKSSYWNSDGDSLYHELKDIISTNCSTGYLLENETIDLGSIEVTGMTLWGDYANGALPLMERDFLKERKKKDLKRFPDAYSIAQAEPIEKGPTPRRKFWEHRQSISYLESLKLTSGKPSVVLTHHPTLLAACCVTDKVNKEVLEYWRIEGSQYAEHLAHKGHSLVINGHLHFGFQHRIFDTIFVSNPWPKGILQIQGQGRLFDPFLRIPVASLLQPI